MISKDLKLKALKSTIEVIKAHGNNPNFGGYSYLPDALKETYEKITELYKNKESKALEEAIDIVKAHGNNATFGGWSYLPQAIEETFKSLKALYENAEKTN